MPVSVTANATTCRAPASAGTSKRGVRPAPARSRSVTAPVSVNLTALESRLRRICCSRWASVTIAGGRSASSVDREVAAPSPRPAARTPARRSRACSSKRDLARLDVHPAGLDLGQVEDVVDQRRAGRSRRCGWCGRTRSASRSGCCSGLSASSRASSSSEFSGVRSSWLMLARNSDLYCEARASCCAFSSRPSRASSISRFLRLDVALLLGQQLRLLLQLGVGALQLGRLVLQLLGQPLRLGEQLLGTPVGLDRVERDADRGDQPVQERQVQLGERGRPTANSITPSSLALEQHRQHHQVARRRRRAGPERSGQAAVVGRRRPGSCGGRPRPGRPAPRRARRSRRGRGPRSRTRRPAAAASPPRSSSARKNAPSCASTSGVTSVMIMRQTSPRSRWPCSRPPMRARLESSQPCSAFFFVVSRSVTIIWLMLSLSSATSPCASTAMRWVRSPRVTDGGHLRRWRAAGWSAWRRAG